jgi:LEA14-like dessication related protein
VIVIIFVGVIGGYYIGFKQVNETADQMLDEVTLVSTKLENVTLLPFTGDLRITYSVRNPATMRIVLNMDADLYYGDVYVGHAVSNEQVVEPESRSDVVVKTSIEGELLKAIQLGAGKSWVLKGTMKFTGFVLGLIPITTTRTGIL